MCTLHEPVVRTTLAEMTRRLITGGSPHRFPRWLAFCQAVDAAAARPRTQPDRYLYHDETYGDIQSVFSEVSSVVPAGRRPLNDDIASELGALTKEIVLSSMLARTPQEPYLSIAHILRDALYRGGLIPTIAASDERWIDAIHIALAYNERRDPKTSATPPPQPSTITFARAVYYFNDKGIDLSLNGDEIVIPSDAGYDGTKVRSHVAMWAPVSHRDQGTGKEPCSWASISDPGIHS